MGKGISAFNASKKIVKTPERAVVRMKIANNSRSALSWIMCIVGIILILNSLDYL
uniref:hypothetical protein n=1 Tax=Paenibacillus sp. IHBB 10380 TaxID=1566358 RepID=UPI000A4A849E|nr:hypothetical protein [Paenibacillus sp. IHBB 10380]